MKFDGMILKARKVFAFVLLARMAMPIACYLILTVIQP